MGEVEPLTCLQGYSCHIYCVGDKAGAGEGEEVLGYAVSVLTAMLPKIELAWILKTTVLSAAIPLYYAGKALPR